MLSKRGWQRRRTHKPTTCWYAKAPNNKLRARLHAANMSCDVTDHSIQGSFLAHCLTPEQCENEALFMIVAGSETTASVIRVTVLHIMSAPRVYNRLKQEIKEALKDGRVTHQPIRIEESRRLPFLQAVIYEGLRMRSPAPGLYAKVVPAGGDTLCGKFVPEGTAIGMNTSAILADKSLFGEDANLFRPERFLEVGDARRAEMQRDVELIFGTGRWMCAGKPVAFMELNKIFFEVIFPYTNRSTRNAGQGAH